MLKIFLSSTFCDLQVEREKLSDKITPALVVVRMESFPPDGQPTQVVAIQNLRQSDIAIFLISPYYGSEIESCKISDCKVTDCLRTGISFTHCEYRVAIAECKPHLVYFINPLPENQEFVQQYERVRDSFLKFKEEVRKTEIAPQIHELNPDQSLQILAGLATNIVKWYSDDKIKIMELYGRGKELRELTDKILTNERVLIHGVGGIGKTTLAHVALMLQVLNGKKIVTIGSRQSYLSGSGYPYFKENKSIHRYETLLSNTISLSDLVNALQVPEGIVKSGKKILWEYLIRKLETPNFLTLIDDYHLADNDVQSLVQQVRHGLILVAKENMPIGRQGLELGGVAEESREQMIIGIAARLNIPITSETINRIAAISEGYPVVMEILVRNYQEVTFDSISEALLSEEKTGEEFLYRAVKSILSKKALTCLQHLSVINPDLESNLEYNALRAVYPNESIKELTRKGLLTKKDTGNDLYKITYESVRQIIISSQDDLKENHEHALRYYQFKSKSFCPENRDDLVEILYHQVKCYPDPSLVPRFQNLCKEFHPHEYGYRRLIKVGEIFQQKLLRPENARVLSILGLICYDFRNYNKADEYFERALEIFIEMARLNPEIYNPDLAVIHNNLGNLYSKTGRYDQAEKSYNVAHEIYTDLARRNPRIYNSDLADSHCNLGTYYQETGRPDQAEKSYNLAKDIYIDLIRQNPRIYSFNLAHVHNNLGANYQQTRRYKRAEKSHRAAVKIFKALARQNSGAYNYNLILAQNNLGCLYREIGKYKLSEQSFNEALTICKELATQNPETYSPDLAMIQHNLGMLYSDTEIYGKADHAYNVALTIRLDLVRQNPDAYNADLASTQNNLGVLYRRMGKDEQAENSYIAALEIYKYLASQNPDVYNQHLAAILKNLGNIYRETGKIGQAKKFDKAALKIFTELVNKNPHFHSNQIQIVNDKSKTRH